MGNRVWCVRKETRQNPRERGIVHEKIIGDEKGKGGGRDIRNRYGTFNNEGRKTREWRIEESETRKDGSTKGLTVQMMGGKRGNGE